MSLATEQRRPDLRGCLGKFGHATAAKAYAVMKAMVRRAKYEPRKGVHLQVYRCHICHHWYVGGGNR